MDSHKKLPPTTEEANAAAVILTIKEDDGDLGTSAPVKIVIEPQPLSGAAKEDAPTLTGEPVDLPTEPDSASHLHELIETPPAKSDEELKNEYASALNHKAAKMADGHQLPQEQQQTGEDRHGEFALDEALQEAVAPGTTACKLSLRRNILEVKQSVQVEEELRNKVSAYERENAALRERVQLLEQREKELKENEELKRQSAFTKECMSSEPPTPAVTPIPVDGRTINNTNQQSQSDTPPLREKSLDLSAASLSPTPATPAPTPVTDVRTIGNNDNQRSVSPPREKSSSLGSTAGVMKAAATQTADPQKAGADHHDPEDSSNEWFQVKTVSDKAESDADEDDFTLPDSPRASKATPARKNALGKSDSHVKLSNNWAGLTVVADHFARKSENTDAAPATPVRSSSPGFSRDGE